MQATRVFVERRVRFLIYGANFVLKENEVDSFEKGMGYCLL